MGHSFLYSMLMLANHLDLAGSGGSSVLFFFMVRTQARSICHKSSDPFYIVTYYIKWVTPS